MSKSGSGPEPTAVEGVGGAVVGTEDTTVRVTPADLAGRTKGSPVAGSSPNTAALPVDAASSDAPTTAAPAKSAPPKGGPALDPGDTRPLTTPARGSRGPNSPAASAGGSPVKADPPARAEAAPAEEATRRIAPAAAKNPPPPSSPAPRVPASLRPATPNGGPGGTASGQNATGGPALDAATVAAPPVPPAPPAPVGRPGNTGPVSGGVPTNGVKTAAPSGNRKGQGPAHTSTQSAANGAPPAPSSAAAKRTAPPAPTGPTAGRSLGQPVAPPPAVRPQPSVKPGAPANSEAAAPPSPFPVRIEPDGAPGRAEAASATGALLPGAPEMPSDPGRPMQQSAPSPAVAEQQRAAEARSASASTAGPRKVKLTLARVDPWSVMKLSFLLAVAYAIAMVVATVVVWEVLNAMGVFSTINESLRDLGGGGSSKFDIGQYLGLGKVVSFVTLLAVLNVIITMALATLGAVLYNLASSLVGGMGMTLTDD